MVPLRPLLEGTRRNAVLRSARPWLVRARLGNNETPQGQARYARRADGPARHRARRSSSAIPSAARSTAAFALAHPESTLGLVFASAATHPWPGGATSWYYTLTTRPLIGWLFSETIAYPAGIGAHAAPRRTASSRRTRRPTTICARAEIPLVLRPATFRANATRCRKPLSLRRRQRAALHDHHGADRRHLGRCRHGRLRGDPFARAGARHSGRGTGLGARISATSRTGSHPISSSPRSRSWPASRSTCRQLARRSKQRIAGDTAGRRRLRQRARLRRKVGG